MTDTTQPGAAPHVVERPVMTQHWRALSYVHWRYPADSVQRMLPDPLVADTHDGSAWVGLVPFSMENIAFRGTPPVPYFGTFPETNIRTYVVGPEGPGVWFHSLDVTRLLPVLVARTTYRLPYMWSKMTIERRNDTVRYSLRRRWPGPSHISSTLALRVGEPITEPTALEHFLSARWMLYTRLGRRMAYARVEHEPWPLQRASIVDLADDLLGAAGYASPDGEPLVMYSPGVTVRVERPRFLAS